MTSTIASQAVAGGFHDGDWVESKDQDPEGEIRLLQLADVGDGIFRDRSDRRLNYDAFERLRCTLVEPGDILIARMPDPIGRACIVPPGLGPTVTVVDVAVLRCDAARADARFVTYAINALPTRAEIEGLQDGATRQRIPRKRLGRIVLPDYPLAEQHAIADFLDRETARIDTLIEEQQRLIELLRERRQGAIDEVFRPLSRESIRLRRIVNFLTSGSCGWGDFYADEGERFLRIGNLPRTGLQLEGGIQYVDLPPQVTEGERTRLRKGDLLFSITAYMGSVAVVDEDWVDGYVSQHVALCRLNLKAADPRFVGWSMLSTNAQNQLRQGAAGGTKQQLALDDIRELEVPLTNIDEQRTAASYLDDQTSTIDTLIAETEKFIELSRERRSTLITAAVTGKIDVRDKVAE